MMLGSLLYKRTWNEIMNHNDKKNNKVLVSNVKKWMLSQTCVHLNMFLNKIVPTVIPQSQSCIKLVEIEVLFLPNDPICLQ